MLRNKKLIICMILCLALIFTGCSSKPAASAASSAPALSSSAVAPAAPAEKKNPFPEGRIEIIASFGPGSGVDLTSRAIAGPLSEVLGVDVIVTNIEGSQGLVGMEQAYKQPADGYTLFLTNQTHLITQVYGLSKTKFTDEFVPVGMLCHDVTVLSTNPTGRFKSWDEIKAFAADHPKEVKVAGTAPNGIDGMTIRQFVKESGVSLDLVSFDNSSEVKSALLGNHVDMSTDDCVSTVPLIGSGDLVGLMVLAENRVDALPDIPCSKELGIDCTIGPWRGLSVKKGTDPEIIAILEKAIKEATERPSWQEFLKSGYLNQRPGYRTAEEFGQMWKDEYAFFEQLAKETA